ncbi:hypothetical protein A3K48_07435 [candidate division WOR-1 bacterium RIFOXYA12_FULL_52_29]|uniref:Uncharacterized protein n=1 Tax=candidate division WOR-1 bacterium RIFOXYC12_FULL_54_18 TaxID=1802584 RepID=A0A1F4T7M8_UNCSA|nr:MAG: hypothetical protein A3K44_07435 [candidate division WOR-1 bacterium RIFOXYA2_FULL_51_19]OGC18345.1 MAG: hypothetical protein A3K48_07435 [candidate division WOR-1 bacterium RIFOXYA12_FULL_52_29]OGC27200.1 MAG: hypothetical protein A3K32_07430 [candidate division WOR-1 bacterium RIFOXYB2_FULL_45_9]OGC28762.1 MAG: hypothetical protein A3K49_07435 [candidate division WOR-1 bacterium RIFOXYC12_FULL_54_18]OGC30783.1 MAG: hypothetical protein A2346_05185 [candidate division WOR-1 bacterium R
MNQWVVDIVQFTNTSPVFKGFGVLFVGAVALLFAWWMRRRWQEPLTGGFLVYIGVASFIVLYGIFMLIVQPHWWNPPY